MQVSTSQLGTSVQKLTVENVSNIPRRNNVLFLSDYLQEQRAHRRYHESDGYKEMASWARQDILLSVSPPEKLASKLLLEINDFLLGTPVLKPRTAAVVEKPAVAKSPAARSLHSEVEDLHNSEAAETLDRQTKHCPRKVSMKAQSSQKDQPNKRKKRTTYSDDDHVKRLEERREKKRVKKKIIEPPVQHASDKENDPRRRASNQVGKKNKSKATSQTDFALMHGFTATNVGKNRITLQSLRNIGVFKKGKASCSLKVGAKNIKKRFEDDTGFSENRFLNKRSCTKRVAASSLSGSVNSERSDVSAEEVVLSSNKKVRRKGTPEQRSTCSRKSTCPYDPANSIIWEIEQESCGDESETNEHQDTITFDLSHNLGSREEEKEQEKAANDLALAGCADTSWSDLAGNFAARNTEMSEVSLRPSQSASQRLGITLNATECRPTISKFFARRDDPLLHDAGAVRSTTPIYHSQNGQSGVYPVRSDPNSSPRIETLRPGLPSVAAGNNPDGLDDLSVAECNTMEGDQDFPDAIVAPPYFGFDFRTNLEYDPELVPPTFEYTHPGSSNHAWDFPHEIYAPLFDEMDDPAAFPNREYEWCPSPCKSEENGEKETLCFDPWADGEAEVEKCYKSFLNEAPVTPLDRDSPNSPFLSRTPDTYDDNDYYSLLGSSCHIDTFSQGRLLLYGLNPSSQRGRSAEAEVARVLKQSHWVPHRF